ncbi:galactokinase [Propionibacterium cyclohexanicum]|uniref:Galactokinase n=1 Tax=Propionibacterium cyclohexanicum TaxID=64702 RepID=A0A1H9RIA4_9ACTN|nr:galactokinase [Propionibacterium cyclohexanicum]SER72377.1 galactokinase [Propionibacterium cyclohexanicum]
MGNLAGRAQQRFEEIFDREPEGIWAAPGRVNLIGEHTDYNGGLCLPIALPQRTYAAAAPRTDDIIRVASLDFDTIAQIDLAQVSPGVPSGWLGYVAGTIWALREFGFLVHGLDLAITSEVPIGAGLSSSAALEAAAGAAASGIFDLGLLRDDTARTTLVEACRRAENYIVEAPTGGLDQTASIRCQAGHALLIDFAEGASASPIPFDTAGHGLSLVVMDTRAEHKLVDGQYAQRRESCEQAAKVLGVDLLSQLTVSDLDWALARLEDETTGRRVRHVLTEIERVRQCCAALEVDDFATVGELFNASHASLRDDYEVSCPELDTAVEAATRAGALGARMTGGGFGGSAIALAPADRVHEITQSVEQAFAAQGWNTPSVFAVQACGPAHRVADEDILTDGADK